MLIVRRYTQDPRLIWTALWLFCLGDWVGQDYFSPQACAYFLYLVVIAVSLRWYSSSGVPLLAAGAGVGAGAATTTQRQPRRRIAILDHADVVLSSRPSPPATS